MRDTEEVLKQTAKALAWLAVAFVWTIIVLFLWGISLTGLVFWLLGATIPVVFSFGGFIEAIESMQETNTYRPPIVSICPNCTATYTDPNLRFCLHDASILIHSDPAKNDFTPKKTVHIPEIVKVPAAPKPMEVKPKHRDPLGIRDEDY